MAAIRTGTPTADPPFYDLSSTKFEPLRRTQFNLSALSTPPHLDRFLALVKYRVAFPLSSAG